MTKINLEQKVRVNHKSNTIAITDNNNSNYLDPLKLYQPEVSIVTFP